MTDTVLDQSTIALLRFAAALHGGSEELLVGLVGEAKRAGTPGEWLDELVLAGVLFVGFPRALVAAASVRREYPECGPQGDAADYSAWRAWRQRGEEACRRIYGSSYQKLRDNVSKLHPVLDAWILMDGYGRTMSRPGLDMRRRELCSVAMLIPQDAPRQLHSHLRGALNCGAMREEVDAAIEAAASVPCVPPQRLAAARAVWRDIR